MQRFYANQSFAFANGATGWRNNSPFDCLGPYAKVTNCPVNVLVWQPHAGREAEPAGTIGCGRYETVDTGVRLTCYAQGHADTFFSVPAATRYRGKRIKGYFTDKEGACVFMATGESAAYFTVK